MEMLRTRARAVSIGQCIPFKESEEIRRTDVDEKLAKDEPFKGQQLLAVRDAQPEGLEVLGYEDKVGRDEAYLRKRDGG